MVCSALIKDEKQQQRAAPTNKPRAGWLWCCRSPELIQIQGLGLPSPEGTAEIWRTKSPKQLETPHSPTVMLLASIYWWKNSPSPTPRKPWNNSYSRQNTPLRVHTCTTVQPALLLLLPIAQNTFGMSQTSGINKHCTSSSPGCILQLDFLHLGKVWPLPGGSWSIRHL